MARRVATSELLALQHDATRVRNICVLAHVDHGKTTLTDSLISSNCIINARSAGKLRYMDDRDDEQERGITMKASAISLLYTATAEDGAPAAGDYLVNLIDSPGHVDFGSEVAGAARLSDGCIVLVDACEGVCIQTHAVLRQAWEESLVPCCVFNKLDRLVAELQMTPTEAASRLRAQLAELNSIWSGFESERYFADADAMGGADGDDNIDNTAPPLFVPDRGNVALASAIDGWALTLPRVARLYAPKLGCSPETLQAALWGDFCLAPRTRVITPCGPGSAHPSSRPLLVSLVLEPLWQLYASGLGLDATALGLPAPPAGAPPKRLTDLAKSLGVTLTTREAAAPDGRPALVTVMRAWQPLSTAILGMVVTQLPDPRRAAPHRLARLSPHLAAATDANDHDGNDARDVSVAVAAVARAVITCDAGPSAPVVVYVAKMFAVPREALPHEQAPAAGDAGSRFVAFARVFSGQLRAGCPLLVLPPEWDPRRPTAVIPVTPRGVYLMMGRALEAVDVVPAGCLAAVTGLEMAVARTATLASVPTCWPLAPLPLPAAPILRVALEPSSPADCAALEAACALLTRADPFVAIAPESATGELVLAAAGEVHLERCLRDLRTRFAPGLPFTASAPLVAFAESVAADGPPAPSPLPSEWPHVAEWVEVVTPGGRCRVRARAAPLPAAVATTLQRSAATIALALAGGPAAHVAATTVRERLVAAVAAGAGSQAEGDALLAMLGRCRALGPGQTGPNVLIAPSGGIPGGATAARALGLSGDSPLGDAPPGGRLESMVTAAAATGFQLACSSGPLCDEPLWGVALVVTTDLAPGMEGGADMGGDAALSGQVIAAAKEACRRAVTLAGPRLVEAVYLCRVVTAADALGRVYAVLHKRRAAILSENLRDGSGLFAVEAHLPAAESFGLAAELRHRTSGAADAQLMLSHWARLCQGGSSETDALADGGEPTGGAALSRRLVDAVRRRKGLPVEAHLVKEATKQRTLSRKV